MGRVLGEGGMAPSALHVVAYGAYRGVDVHALAIAGGVPFGERVAIDYPLGLAREGAAGERAPSSVVVGDPTSDLPEALLESKEVGALLRSARTGHLLVCGRCAAAWSSSLLSRSICCIGAGHGVFAGTDGVDSALPLAKGGALTVGDILAASPVPRTVVLAGCEAARDAAGGAAGLGLAQAFVAAGADAVLAPTRKVPDALAHRSRGSWAILFVAKRSSLAATRPSVRASDPSADWSSFRVVTR
ncbi:MAG: CHAT domain-containing protein [Polyangiaceae bacterium]